MGERRHLAFGALPQDRRYRLSRARFAVLADELAALTRARGRALRVLDAGLGQAKLERVFQALHPDLPAPRWIGLDLLRFRLELRLDVPGIARVVGDVTALPFADACCDAAVSSWVLQHVPGPERALRELARVLVPGGRLLLAVPGGPPALRVLRRLVHPGWVALERRLLDKRSSYSPQVEFYDLPRVRRLVADAGLSPLRWQGLGFVSGGPLKPLENLGWYYRLNLWAGARLPGWAQCLVCVAERPMEPGLSSGRSADGTA